MLPVQEKENVAKEIRTAVRHGAVYGLGGVLAKAVGFLMLPFYTHYLNPADYGTLEILDLSMSLFGMFLNMGITAALLRCHSAAATAEEKRKVVSSAFIFVAVTGVATFFLLVGLVRPVSALLLGPRVPSQYLLLSFTAFIIGYITNLPRTYLRALEASGSFVLVETVSLFLMLTLNIVFIAVLKIGLAGILWSSLLVAILQLVLLCGWLLRRVGIGFSQRLLGAMMRFGLPLIFSNLAMFTLNFSDRFFLQRFRSLEVVGVYAVGYKFGYMLNYLLVQPFYVMWQSRMYAIHAQPDHPKVFSQMFVFYSLLLTYAALALAMLSPEMVQFMLAANFSESRNVIPVVALAYVFCGIGYYVQLGMFLTNRTNLIGVVSAAAAGLNLLLNYFLVAHYGMPGAAWATVVSFFAIAAGSYWCSQRVYALPLKVGRTASALVLAFALYMVSRVWNPGSLALTLALKTCLLAVFPVLVWKARILSPAEVGTLISTMDHAGAGTARLFRVFSRKAASL